VPGAEKIVVGTTMRAARPARSIPGGPLSEPPEVSMYPANAHVIRPAEPGDAVTLRRMAFLARRAPLAGRIHVAEVRGAVAAGISRDEGRTLADASLAPAYLTALLRLRMSALDAAEREPDLGLRLRDALRGRPPADLPQAAPLAR
jgi:hypothetical protein